MKKTILLFLLLPFSVFCQLPDNLKENKSKGNLRFVENKNQWENNVLYKADLNGGALFLEKNCFTFLFKDMTAINKVLEFKYPDSEKSDSISPPDYNIKCHAYKINFLNAKKDVTVSAENPDESYVNYYTGNDKTKWASNVKAYDHVTYKGIYDKTDLNIYESEGQLKYDITLHPGANTDNIQFEYEGADMVYIQNSNLVVKTSVNEIGELTPIAYQIKGKDKEYVECKFRLTNNILSFVFPNGFDKTNELIIDPVLIFSTYSGSTADNWGFAATYDSKGDVYSAGIVFGTGYPVTTGAFQINFAGGESGAYLSGCDIAIIKYDSTGTKRLWATYLGGSRNELPHSLIVNNADDLLIYGTTGSSDFPVTSGAFDQTFKGGDSIAYAYNSIKFSHGTDIFVAKLSSDGTHLLASTYVGGSNNDGLNYPSPLSINYGDGARGEILVDANDNVYVTSSTQSTDFPVTVGTFQPNFGGGGQDGVVFKMDATLSNMIWSSYIGGNGSDAVYSMVLDANNNMYVTGGTTSTNFPVTSGTLHTSYMGGYSDGFIAEISQDGTSLLKSTYYGSSAYDQSYFIDRDQAGNIYVFGQTSDTTKAFIFNAAWNKPKGGQFISKITPDLSTLIWSTTFGTGNTSSSGWTPTFGTGKGCPDISPNAFFVDLCNNIYLTGWGGPNLNGFGGTSGLPISGNAFQTTTDNNDFYILEIDKDASSMLYGSYFGSPHAYEHVDGGTSRFDRYGKLYQGVCGGCGGWSDFPTTPGVWSNTNNSSNCNNAVIKFDFQPNQVLAIANATPNDTGCMHYNFTNSSNAVSYIWNFGDGSSLSTQVSPTHIYSIQGTYNVSLIAIDSSKCNISDSTTLTIYAGTIPTPVISLQNDTLSSNSLSGNQWYFSNAMIIGATGNTYLPVVTGYYFDIVTDISGCVSDTSNIIYVITAGLKETPDNDKISLYPDPTTDNITIENTSFTKGQTISIYDVQGQLLLQQPMLQAKTNINISAFSKGLYFLKVENENVVAVKKFEKE
jgi:PKD repeat protein